MCKEGRAQKRHSGALTVLVITLLKVIIEDKVLDPLLFLPLCLLLCLHSNCKRRVRGELDCPSLTATSASNPQRSLGRRGRDSNIPVAGCLSLSSTKRPFCRSAASPQCQWTWTVHDFSTARGAARQTAVCAQTCVIRGFLPSSWRTLVQTRLHPRGPQLLLAW